MLTLTQAMTREITQDRRGFLASAAATIAGLEFTMLGSTKSLLSGMGPATDNRLAALRKATTWLNSPPLTEAGLRGKVVLVDFCTYTCINWLRTLPYVRAWTEKYRDHGLVVIGVHTPEFGFESNLENVRRAIQDLRVTYPIAVDNEYAIWRSFDNRYWPALYFVDAKGDLRDRQFGEGDYDKAEMMIQKLLADAGATGIGREVVAVNGQGIEAAPDWDSLASPENYLGSDRTANFVSTRGAATASGHMYGVPARPRRNEWALAGDWTRGPQAVALNAPNGRIVSRFHARDLHLVMGPAVKETSVRYRVRIDGDPPSAAHGIDVDAQGQGTVTQQRLHQLIRQPRPITDRQFEIEFLDPGVEAYAFTFG
jgi:thiol-disulfide isomerase/thioredoxin